jgi:hypothetical protein
MAAEKHKRPGAINRGMTDGQEDQTLKNTFGTITLEGLTYGGENSPVT